MPTNRARMITMAERGVDDHLLEQPGVGAEIARVLARRLREATRPRNTVG